MKLAISKNTPPQQTSYSLRTCLPLQAELGSHVPLQPALILGTADSFGPSRMKLWVTGELPLSPYPISNWGPVSDQQGPQSSSPDCHPHWAAQRPLTPRPSIMGDL